MRIPLFCALIMALSGCSLPDSRDHPAPSCRGGIYGYPYDRCQWAQVKHGSTFDRGEMRWVRMPNGSVIGRDYGPDLYDPVQQYVTEHDPHYGGDPRKKP